MYMYCKDGLYWRIHFKSDWRQIFPRFLVFHNFIEFDFVLDLGQG